MSNLKKKNFKKKNTKKKKTKKKKKQRTLDIMVFIKLSLYLKKIQTLSFIIIKITITKTIT